MTSSFAPLPRIAALSVALVILATVDLTAQPRQIPPFDGVWKLNVEASVHPNGPALPARGPWPASAFDLSTGGAVPRELPGPSDRGSDGDQAQVRFDAMTTLFFRAPPRLSVWATAAEFKIELDNRAGADTGSTPATSSTRTGPITEPSRWSPSPVPPSSRSGGMGTRFGVSSRPRTR